MGQAWHVLPEQTIELREHAGGRTLNVPAGALFEDATLVAFAVPVERVGELEPLGDAWRVEPETRQIHIFDCGCGILHRTSRPRKCRCCREPCSCPRHARGNAHQ